MSTYSEQYLNANELAAVKVALDAMDTMTGSEVSAEIVLYDVNGEELGKVSESGDGKYAFFPAIPQGQVNEFKAEARRADAQHDFNQR